MTDPNRTKTDAEISSLVQQAAALGPYPKYLKQTAEQFACWADAELARQAVAPAADAVADGSATDAATVQPTPSNTDAVVVPAPDNTGGRARRSGPLRVLDAAVAQAAFDAAWDRPTQQHARGPLAALTLLRQHADAASSHDAGQYTVLDLLTRWLDGGPEHRDPNAESLEVQTRHSGSERAYTFLSDQPHDPTAGYLGRLGRYRVIRELGHGATSLVFAAEKDSLDDAVPTPCVVKVLAPIVQPDEQARARFVREAKTACHLDHRNIVRVHDAGEENGVAWVEMDYVYGPSLRDLMEHHSGPMPLDLALDLVRQVALGLAAAHAASAPVIHRDLKPANVLLERVLADAAHPHRWRALVSDFGVVRAVHDPCVTRSEVAVGTIAYASPEQLNGSSSICSKTDLFSLGAVLYEMLTGSHPYWHSEDDTSPTVARRIWFAATPPPREVNPAIPESVAEFVLRMLHHTPEHRPTAAEVAVKLSGILRVDERAGGPPEASQTTPTVAQSRSSIRYPAGDRRAFGTFYQNHSAALSKNLRGSWRKSPEWVEEVVQDALMAFWQLPYDSPLRAAPDDQISEWLSRVALTRLMARQLMERRKLLSRADNVDDLANDLRDQHDDPVQRAEYEDSARRLYDLIQTLPPDEREVITLVYLNELTSEEIGKRLCIPAGTVRARLYRARMRLLAALSESETVLNEWSQRDE